MKPFGKYTGDPICQFNAARNEWCVMHTFWFVRPNGDGIMVPAGLWTDLASTGDIPLFPRDSVYNQAAMVHDYLYVAEIFDRKTCDVIFREALEAIPQVPRWKIPLMYAAVRAFGGRCFPHCIRRVINARRLAGLRDITTRPLWPDGIARFV